MVVRGLAVLGVMSCGALACVHIPDSLRAEFREVGPGERSNFRPGAHGSARGRDLVGPMPTLASDAGEADAAASPAATSAAAVAPAPAASEAPPAAPPVAPAAQADGGVS